MYYSNAVHSGNKDVVINTSKVQLSFTDVEQDHFSNEMVTEKDITEFTGLFLLRE